MGFCSVRWCGKSSKTSNYKKDGITFHRFPKSPAMKSKWIDATHREEKTWYPSSTSVICSRHFTADCFHSLANQRRRLLNSAVPTLRLPVLVDHSVEDEQQQLDVDEGTSTSTKLDSTLQNSTSKQQDPLSQTSNRKKELSQICVCDPDTPSACDTTVVKRLCRRIAELQSVIKQKNVKMRKLYDSNRRLQQKVVDLKSLLEERGEND